MYVIKKLKTLFASYHEDEQYLTSFGMSVRKHVTRKNKNLYLLVAVCVRIVYSELNGCVLRKPCNSTQDSGECVCETN